MFVVGWVGFDRLHVSQQAIVLVFSHLRNVSKVHAVLWLR